MVGIKDVLCHIAGSLRKKPGLPLVDLITQRKKEVPLFGADREEELNLPPDIANRIDIVNQTLVTSRTLGLPTDQVA